MTLTPLQASQYQFYATPSGEITITASGGNGSYIWLAESESGGYFESGAGSVTVFNGQTAVYHLPDQPGEYVITLTDGTTNRQITVNSKIPTALTVSPEAVILASTKSSSRLFVIAQYNDGTTGVPGNITWSSHAPEIVSVSEGGTITPVAAGTTTVTAEYQGISASCAVTVDTTPIALEIEPSLLFLKPGESVVLQVTATYRDGTTVAAADAVLSKDFDVVTLDGKTVTGVSGGHAEITASLNGLSASAVVQVTAPSPLSLNPPSLRLVKNESQTVAISGGTLPFTADSGTVAGEWGREWRITAPAAAGEHLYTITDAAGSEAVLKIIVFEDFDIQTSKTDGAVSEEITITPKGGVPPYSWMATAGELSTMETLDRSSVTYIFPAVSGVFTVSAVDSNGMDASVVLTTITELMVSPANLYLDMEADKKIEVLGGSPPYQATVISGSINKQSDNTFVYTAPSLFGESQVTIIDQKGTRKSVSVHITRPVNVTPSKAILSPEAQRTFHVTGGFSGDDGISVVTLSGTASVHPENRIINYTAPVVTGPDVIFVSDRSGNQKQVSIEVSSEDFFVSPSNIFRLKGEEVVFNAVKGTGTISWCCDQGDIIKNADTDSMTYKAPEIKGEYRITASDSIGKTAEAVVHVVNEMVHITPLEVVTGPGDPMKFKVFGGAGGYQFKITDGYIDKDVNDEGKIVYIAPWVSGEYFVTVMDRAGAWSKARVVVSGTPDFTPVLPGDVIYDIVNQVKDMGSYKVEDNNDSFRIEFSLDYNPAIPLPVKLYLRWKLPNGRLLYVKTWDGTTAFKESGMELVSDVQDFIGQFPLQGNLFQNFGIYGDLFSEMPKSFLNDLGGKGNYRFEIIIKPVGAIQNDEYTIPVYLKL